MKSFFAGLGCGVIAGLLLAPKRGELIRADLRKRAQGLKRASADKADAVVELLNTATREALIVVHGIGEVLADRIMENRPYQKAYEVVEKGILPESTFLQLRRELLEKSA
jgi:gas vesicle protein